jgi:hypothetical protein
MASRDAKLCRQASGRHHPETQAAQGVQTGRDDDVGIGAVSAQVALSSLPGVNGPTALAIAVVDMYATAPAAVGNGTP